MQENRELQNVSIHLLEDCDIDSHGRKRGLERLFKRNKDVMVAKAQARLERRVGRADAVHKSVDFPAAAQHPPSGARETESSTMAVSSALCFAALLLLLLCCFRATYLSLLLLCSVRPCRYSL